MSITYIQALFSFQYRTIAHTTQQTETFETKDAELQTSYTTSQQVQTEEVSLDSQVRYDTPSLMSFLRLATPIMLKQIETNNQSHAFDCYDFNTVDDSDEKLTLLHALTCPDVGDEMQCTDLSWNSTGTVIAVSYGASVHDGWCTHISGIAIWNLNRRDFSESKPNVFVESSVCLNNVLFHPLKPALIAGGSHNGSLYCDLVTLGHLSLWNLSQDDLLVASTATDEVGHNETVTSLHWIKERDLNLQYLLVSSGLDGKILLWRFSDRSLQLKLMKGFLMLIENLPRALRQGLTSRRNGEVGVTGLSFCNDDPDIFFAAIEGGGLIQCSLESQLSTNGTVGKGVPLLSPIVLAFTPHIGHVSYVSCSPFQRNLVASCGSDGELRVHSLLQPTVPIIMAHFFTALEFLCWSPVRPLIMAAVSSAGEILLLNIQHAQFGPEFRFMDDGECSKIMFNNKDFKLIATASKRNKAKVWQLGAEYSLCSSSHELKIASELAKNVQ